MRAGGDVGEAPVEFQFDGPGGDFEREGAIGAVIVFPTVMNQGEAIIAKRFNGLAQRMQRRDRGIVTKLSLLVRNTAGGQFDAAILAAG